MNTIEKTHPGMSRKSLPVLFAALCVLLCLSACRPKPYPSLLLVADSLASVLPDSACALLASYAADTADEPLYVRMYYRLLCIKAKDKAYIVHTSDSAILPVVAYYEHYKRLPHLPEAYYYAGRVYRDLGDAPQALAYFQRALDAMREDEDMKIKTKTYAQMGTLFIFQHLYSNALEMFKQSLQCDFTMKDSVGIIFNYRDIATIFRYVGEADSALYYFQKSDQLCKLIKRPDLGKMVQSQLASFFLDRNEYEKAKESLQKALQGVKVYERSSIYSIAARYYSGIGNKDSAVWYMQELSKCGNIYAKEKAYRGLAEYSLAKRNPIAATYYLSQSFILSDSIREMTDSETIAHMHAFYNYQLREKENLYLRLEQEKSKRYNFYILTGSVVLLVIIILSFYRHKKIIQRRLKTAERLRVEAYHRSQQYIEDNCEQIRLLENYIRNLKSQLQDSTLKCKQMEQEKHIIINLNQQVELKQNKRQLDENLFFQSDIYNLFLQRLETGKVPILTEWEQLSKQLNLSFDNFTQKILQLGPLKEKELHVCLLIKAQFKNKEIAQLLCLSPEGISSVRRRLCIKFLEGKSEAKEWDRFIRSL